MAGLFFIALAVLAVIFVPAVRRFAIGAVVLAIVGYMALSAANQRYQAAKSQVASFASAPTSAAGVRSWASRVFDEDWQPFMAGDFWSTRLGLAPSPCCIQPGDVQQGHLGDCWLLASLAAVARTNPGAIKRAIQSQGDGTYIVTLFTPQNGQLAARGVHVAPVFPEYQATFFQRVFSPDSRFPYAQPGDNRNEAWVMLFEKAAASVRGSYEKLDEGTGLEGLQLVTGRKVESFEPRTLAPDALAARLTQLEAANYPVTAGTFKSNQIVESGPNPLLIGKEEDTKLDNDHLYYVVHYDPASRTITVGNQHEKNVTTALTLQEFQFAFTGVFYTELTNTGDGCTCT